MPFDVLRELLSAPQLAYGRLQRMAYGILGGDHVV